MGNRIIWKLVASFVLLILVSVVIMSFFVSIKLTDHVEEAITGRLGANAALVGSLIQHEIDSLDKPIQEIVDEIALSVESRITVMDVSGGVLADSWSEAISMEDHSDRPEVRSALLGGVGQSTRMSETMGYRMKYVAVKVGGSGGPEGLVRLALPLSEVDSSVKDIYMVVLMGGLVAVGFVIIMGFYVSRGIIGPLSEMTEVARSITAGDFSRRLKLKGTDELAILAASLNRMSDELAQKMESLEKASLIKTDLVANVSHEMKTPLTSILGYIETLEDGALEDSDNARRFLSIIRRQARGLSNTINDLLELSELERAEAGELEMEELDLRELLREVAAGFDNAAGAKRQALLIGYKGDDMRVMGDRLKIEHALINIIDNAVKYTPEGGEINVLIRDKGERKDISVSDTGIGIPVEHLGRVFERFYRVDKARSRRVGGTGLGLAIVKHTVALHGGSVKIDSEPGKGTVVTISLPKAI
jgi:two-component system phosphate regulon sensor histidine kinase PhoR